MVSCHAIFHKWKKKKSLRSSCFFNTARVWMYFRLFFGTNGFFYYFVLNRTESIISTQMSHIYKVLLGGYQDVYYALVL